MAQTHTFYDVKTSQKITTAVTNKIRYVKGERVRHAVKGTTEDGRSLTAFVNEADFNSCSAAQLPDQVSKKD